MSAIETQTVAGGQYADPVVEEIRKTSEKLTRECGGDIHRIAERLRQRQESEGRTVVRRSDRGARTPGGAPSE